MADIVTEAGFKDTAEWLEAGELFRSIQAGSATDVQQVEFTGIYADRWRRWQRLREAELRAIEQRSARAGAPPDPAEQVQSDMLEAMRRARIPIVQKRPAGAPLVSVKGYGLIAERDVQPYRSSDDRAGTARGVDRIAAALGRS